jgi:membrane fusion protein, multidrug efflux system
VALETASTATTQPERVQVPATPPPRRLPGWIVPAVIFFLAAGLLFTITSDWNAWTGGVARQTTDDAYLHADLTPLSTKVSGVVAKVNVTDYQHVKAGDLLVQLKDDDFQAQVSQAEAGVAAAKAGIEDNLRQEQLQQAKIERALAGVEEAKAGILAARAEIADAQAGLDRTLPERHRQETLFASSAATQQKLEQAVAEEEHSRAQLASAQAGQQQSQALHSSSESAVEAERRGFVVQKSLEGQLLADLDAKKAELTAALSNLAYTRISAPTDGVVGERKVRPGQMVNPGTQVISLVEDDVWVEANYRETQLRHVAVGDTAEIKIDAFAGVMFHGKVDSLSPASGSQFSLLPPDNATGNFTKITQRIPVKITFDPDSRLAGRLRPGMSVVVTIDTHSVR